MLSATAAPAALRLYTAAELGAEPADLADLAARWQAQGRIAYAVEGGIAEYPGRWRGDADGTWAEQGAAEAEGRVHRWLGGLAAHYPEALRDAAALVLSSTTPAMLRAALAPRLKWWSRGVTAAGGDGVAERAQAEAEVWAAFRQRLAELSAA